MKCQTYTPSLGEDIKTCIENSLQQSKRQKIPVKFTFNGTNMKIDSGLNVGVEFYIESWRAEFRHQQRKYEKSEEYDLVQEKNRVKLEHYQAEMYSLMEEYYLGIHGNNMECTEPSVLYWFQRFILLADRVGVSFDKGIIL